MICGVNQLINQILTNLKPLPPMSTFTIKEILGEELYESLDNAEKDYIDSHFNELVLRQEILGINYLNSDNNIAHYIKHF